MTGVKYAATAQRKGPPPQDKNICPKVKALLFLLYRFTIVQCTFVLPSTLLLTMCKSNMNEV